MRFRLRKPCADWNSQPRLSFWGSWGNLHKVIALITRAQQNIPKELSKVQDSFRIRLAKVNPSIPALLFFRAVENDNSLELGRLIDNTCKGDLGFSRTEFLYVLFQCSTQCSYHSWVDVLISCAHFPGRGYSDRELSSEHHC